MDLSPDEENFQGRLLHQAALWDNLELLQELLASGAGVVARDAHINALHATALAEKSTCLSALCAAGADVNAKSDQETEGKTALHIALERGHRQKAQALLRAGADLTLLTAESDSALELPEQLRDRQTPRSHSGKLRLEVFLSPHISDVWSLGQENSQPPGAGGAEELLHEGAGSVSQHHLLSVDMLLDLGADRGGAGILLRTELGEELV